MHNSSRLVRAIVNYGIYYGRYNSFIGHNVLFYLRKYNVKVCEIGSGKADAKCVVNKYAIRQIEERQVQTCFLRELILLRDNVLVFFE